MPIIVSNCLLYTVSPQINAFYILGKNSKTYKIVFEVQPNQIVSCQSHKGKGKVTANFVKASTWKMEEGFRREPKWVNRWQGIRVHDMEKECCLNRKMAVLGRETMNFCSRGNLCDQGTLHTEACQWDWRKCLMGGLSESLEWREWGKGWVADHRQCRIVSHERVGWE